MKAKAGKRAVVAAFDAGAGRRPRRAAGWAAREEAAQGGKGGGPGREGKRAARVEKKDRRPV